MTSTVWQSWHVVNDIPKVVTGNWQKPLPGFCNENSQCEQDVSFRWERYNTSLVHSLRRKKCVGMEERQAYRTT